MSTPARSFVLGNATQQVFTSPAVPQGKRLKVVVNGAPAVYTFASATSIRLDRAARARSIVDMFLEDLDGSIAARAGSWMSSGLNPGSIPAGGTFSVTAVIPGATMGDPLLVALPAGIPDGICGDAVVTAADTVKVRLQNHTTAAIVVPAGEIRVSLMKA